jgi:hypothetical protein
MPGAVHLWNPSVHNGGKTASGRCNYYRENLGSSKSPQIARPLTVIEKRRAASAVGRLRCRTTRLWDSGGRRIGAFESRIGWKLAKRFRTERTLYSHTSSPTLKRFIRPFFNHFVVTPKNTTVLNAFLVNLYNIIRYL